MLPSRADGDELAAGAAQHDPVIFLRVFGSFDAALRLEPQKLQRCEQLKDPPLSSSL
jgi:hypothetical protein